MSSNTSAILHGTGDIKEQPGAFIEDTRDGDSVGGSSFTIAVANWTGWLPFMNLNADHPEEGDLFVVRRRRERRGDVYVITLSYRGFTDSGQAGTEQRPRIDYGGGSQQLPITNHPLFREWAGDPNVSDDGDPALLSPAQFLQDGALVDSRFFLEARTAGQGAIWQTEPPQFVGFNRPDGDLFGIDTYIDNSKQVVRSWSSTNEPDFSVEGTLEDTVPGAGVINDPTVVNWLCVDVNAVQIGVGARRYFQVRQTWLGSATGHPALVYPVNGGGSE